MAFLDLSAERQLPCQHSAPATMHGSGCWESHDFFWYCFLADTAIHQIYQLIILIYIFTITYSVLFLFVRIQFWLLQQTQQSLTLVSIGISKATKSHAKVTSTWKTRPLEMHSASVSCPSKTDKLQPKIDQCLEMVLWISIECL